MSDPIIIVGAGIGGMSAAIRLALAGLPVRVFEKNDTPGGKMAETSIDGFRWDTGPSVLTMRDVFEELFAAAGRHLDDYVTLLPVDPLTRYHFADGSRLDAKLDRAAMDEQIAALAPNDVDGFHRFLAYATRIHDLTDPVFVRGKPPSMRSFGASNPLNVLRIGAFTSLHNAVSRHVESENLRMVLDRFATYVGGNPYVAPATLATIAHTELIDGVWYPRGGVFQMAYALWRLAVEVGVEIVTGQRVEQITVEDKRATGVTLVDSTHVPAAAVVSNLDVTETVRTLLPRTKETSALFDHLRHTETSCSGFVLLLGVEGVTPGIVHHNLWFPWDYRQEFIDIFSRQRPAEEPAIYAAVTCKTDPSHAPEGSENWFILVNAPSTASQFDWRHNADEYGDHVLDVLAARGVDLRQRIRIRRTLTPADLARQTGAWNGALYGISSNRAINAFRRPNNRSPVVKGLYFAGGTTHPGGGVPMVTLSGAVAAQMVVSDLAGKKAAE